MGGGGRKGERGSIGRERELNEGGGREREGGE